MKTVTCVISAWNSREHVRANLLALRQQTYPPFEIIVVDNHSKDGTADMLEKEFPEATLISMPHSDFGACETFNEGFRAAKGEFTAIMDDDVVAPPRWIETIMSRFEEEPETTGMVSSKVIEPGMPDSHIDAPEVNRIRYMATFRGCATIARSSVLRDAGYYDEKFFIYGNERDLAARILTDGFRILQYPKAAVFHATPFGLKPGKRSLYFHVRNFWLYAFKNCAWVDVVRTGFKLSLKALGRQGVSHADAVGVVGLDKSVKETPGGYWIAIKATMHAVWMLPHCFRNRHVCRAPDFVPPLR